MKRIIMPAIALAIGAFGLLVASASTASAATTSGCVPNAPGVYAQVDRSGHTSYRQDSRCGDPGDPHTRRPPRTSKPHKPTRQNDCRDVLVGGKSIGELCGDGLRSNPYDVGGRVWIGGGGGFVGTGSYPTGTVTIGELENPDKPKKNER